MLKSFFHLNSKMFCRSFADDNSRDGRWEMGDGMLWWVKCTCFWRNDKWMDGFTSSKCVCTEMGWNVECVKTMDFQFSQVAWNSNIISIYVHVSIAAYRVSRQIHSLDSKRCSNLREMRIVNLWRRTYCMLSACVWVCVNLKFETNACHCESFIIYGCATIYELCIEWIEIGKSGMRIILTR